MESIGTALALALAHATARNVASVRAGLITVLALALPAQTPAERAPAPWPEADAMFARDAHWLGGDAVYSVALDERRILWLFGDSFVGLDGKRDRRSAAMVRNTIAVQDGRDPATASLQFHWRLENARAAPFFASDETLGSGALGIWPLDGVRVPKGPLLLWQTLVRDTPGEGLGFAIDGCRLWCIDEPDAPPERWRGRRIRIAPPAGVTLGTATFVDGAHLTALGTTGNGPHRGVLVRLRLADLERTDAERTVPLEGWLGTAWGPATAADALATVLDDGGPECSLHHDGSAWQHVRSRGFGAVPVVRRTAPAATGPWRAATELFVPPEIGAAPPLAKLLVYAGKAHPELDAGDGALAVSYATNSLEFAALFDERGQRVLYWPRFWRVPAR